MASFEVFHFQDTNHNTIRYLFNPAKKQDDTANPIPLDQLIETFDAELDGPPTSPGIPEPKAGTEFFSYKARDGAEVRYQFDPAARNGKQYVVAIHREPDNWRMLQAEDFAVEDEMELRRRYEQREGEEVVMKRRDSVNGESEFDGRMDVEE